MKTQHPIASAVADFERVYRMFPEPETLARIKYLAQFATVTHAGKTISRVNYPDGSQGAIRNSRLPLAVQA